MRCYQKKKCVQKVYGQKKVCEMFSGKKPHDEFALKKKTKQGDVYKKE